MYRRRNKLYIMNYYICLVCAVTTTAVACV